MQEKNNEYHRKIYRSVPGLCQRQAGFAGGIRKNDERIRRFFSMGFQYEEYENPLYYTLESFVSRSLSGSYSLKEGDLGYQEYLRKIRLIFEKYEKNGLAEMPNITVVYSGRMS